MKRSKLEETDTELFFLADKIHVLKTKGCSITHLLCGFKSCKHKMVRFMSSARYDC